MDVYYYDRICSDFLLSFIFVEQYTYALDIFLNIVVIHFVSELDDIMLCFSEKGEVLFTDLKELVTKFRETALPHLKYMHFNGTINLISIAVTQQIISILISLFLLTSFGECICASAAKRYGSLLRVCAIRNQI
jgi:hypothetical protein